MRYRRFEQQRGTYEDLVDIPRHLAALGRYDEAADVAGQAGGMLGGTLAVVAYLAEVRPLIPPAERAWILVAEQEVRRPAAGRGPAVGDPAAARHPRPGPGPGCADPGRHRMAAGPVRQPQQLGGRGDRGRGPDRGPRRLPGRPWTSGSGWPPPTRPTPAGSATCPSATTSWGTWRSRPGTWPRPGPPTRPAWTSAVRLAAADPANTEWQRDLSVSHNILGNVAVAAGDLAAARAAYQAGLDIAARLAAADPANTGWQRDLSVSHNKLGDVAVAAGDLAAARAAYQAYLDIAARLAAADPANTAGSATCPSATTSWGTWRSRPGTWPRPGPPTRPAWTSRSGWPPPTRPTPRWQRDLSVSHEPAGGRGDRGRGPGRGPGRLPGRPGHPGPAGRRRPGQHRVAARPVRQPRQAGGRGDRGRGPGRGPRRLPGLPGHRGPAGRRRPGQHRLAARPVRQPRTSWGTWRSRPGTWPRPGPPTRPPWTSRSGWPPPTRPTPAGSATCPSATTSWGTWRSRPGT